MKLHGAIRLALAGVAGLAAVGHADADRDEMLEKCFVEWYGSSASQSCGKVAPSGAEHRPRRP